MVQRKLLLPSFLLIARIYGKNEVSTIYYQKIVSSIAPYPKIDRTHEENEGNFEIN
jgi:hypothetical protein